MKLHRRSQTGEAEWNRMDADIIERREYFSVFPDIVLLRKYKKELSCVGECYRRQGLSISGINFVVVRLRKNTIRQTRHRKREKNKESGREGKKGE